MIKVENVDVWGFEHAVRGMRNPLNSWSRSDSITDAGYGRDRVIIGDEDLKLMKKLFNAGSEHRKYLRQIFISMDITAPFYFWKQFDTYKIGTVANSCSTMHKITSKEFVMDDFSNEHVNNLKGEMKIAVVRYWEEVLRCLNLMRDKYLKTKDKTYWWIIIQSLPDSYNQKRTITMNYENVFNIIKQRSNHKLDEWHDLIDELKKLPYVKSLLNEE